MVHTTLSSVSGTGRSEGKDGTQATTRVSGSVYRLSRLRGSLCSPPPGVFGRAPARIEVVKWEEISLDYPKCVPPLRHPPCVAACPTDALHRDEATGTVLLSARSASAAELAWTNALRAADLHPETGFVVICDPCGGDPACLKRCATQAIVHEKSDTEVRRGGEKMEVKTHEGYSRGGS